MCRPTSCRLLLGYFSKKIILTPLIAWRKVVFMEVQIIIQLQVMRLTFRIRTYTDNPLDILLNIGSLFCDFKFKIEQLNSFFILFMAYWYLH